MGFEGRGYKEEGLCLCVRKGEGEREQQEESGRSQRGAEQRKGGIYHPKSRIMTCLRCTGG